VERAAKPGFEHFAAGESVEVLMPMPREGKY
jgi:hypothetical protein